MDSLRLILLLVGVAFVLGLYGWICFKQRPQEAAPARRREPHPLDDIAPLQVDPAMDDIDAELERMGRLVAEEADAVDDKAGVVSPAQSAAASASAPAQLIVISVMAPTGTLFSGAALVRAFEHNQLHYGEQRFYHRNVSPDDVEQVLFTVANAVKPGTLPGHADGDFNSPGITFFLQLPGPMENVSAFDSMLTTAERIAVEIGGELQDQRHEKLSEMTVAELRNALAGSGVPVPG